MASYARLTASERRAAEVNYSRLMVALRVLKYENRRALSKRAVESVLRAIDMEHHVAPDAVRDWIRHTWQSKFAPPAQRTGPRIMTYKRSNGAARP